MILAFLLFRPLVQRSRPSPRDRDLALVRNYGEDTLAYFALREDKSYFFFSERRAMIAYAYLRGYALAAGDPIGPRDAIPGVLDEFVAFCRDRAWHLAFLSVREEDLPLYRERGLHSVYLGDEAIIRCDRFTLEGSEMKAVRSAVHRVGRKHRFALIRESDAPPALVEELNEISRRWRGKAPERGFTMELGQEVKGRKPGLPSRSRLQRVGQARGLPAAGALLRAGPRLLARPDAKAPRRRQRDDRVPDRQRLPCPR